MSRPPESFTTRLQKPLFDALLPDEEAAQEFGALILKRLHGEAELSRQQPLRATDQDEDWLIEGSPQTASRLLRPAAWFIKVRKSDCQVDEHGYWFSMETPDAVKAIIDKMKGSEEKP